MFRLPALLARTITPLLLTGVAMAAVPRPMPKAVDAAPTQREWNLVWQDEFEGPIDQLPDASRWGYDIGTNWGNNQLEWDSDRPENVSLDGEGHLRLIARQESLNGCAYSSARIVTRDLYEPTYGRYEARMKLPVGQGIWPAFWLLGANIEETPWPGCGEVDIMEYRGQQPQINWGTVHGPGYSGGGGVSHIFDLESGGFHQDFHVFAVEWGEDYIQWEIDGEVYGRVTPSDLNGDWVFNHPFYIIINIAVGGSFVGSPDSCTRFPQTMLVDWVRVYQEG